MKIPIGIERMRNLLEPIEAFYESLINAQALIPVNAAINAR
jgi:hypothetical protein